MRQYEMCEVTLKGNTDREHWAEANVNAVFSCGEISHKVKGFIAGEDCYKVRFLPEVAGTWKYTVSGAVSAEGVVEVKPAAEGNHGKVSAVDTHFEYQDGTFCYPFGTTIYALVHQSEELFEETMETLEKAPFNKIRFCIFPKHYDFNHNEPRYYAFEKDAEGKWDVTRPCFTYWEMLEDAILRLQKMGTECDLILFHPYDRWDFSKFTEEEDMIYLDYLLRRLSAMPNVWWSMANEYDLVPSKTLKHWEHIEEFLAENDPYHHLIGNHNCFKFWDHTRKNITHASLQTKMLTRINEWRNEYKKPVCIDECCYEGNIIHPWGSISGREMTYRFWRTVVTGGYCTHGETYYNDREVIWWARGGQLIGSSPERIGFLRNLVNELPGPIEPTPGFIESFLYIDPETIKEKLKDVSPEHAFMVSRINALPKDELKLYVATDPYYAGHVGEDAYIVFYDIRTCSKSELELPEKNKYRLELINVWDMTREIIKETVSGKVEFDMPGKEGYAVLATRI